MRKQQIGTWFVWGVVLVMIGLAPLPAATQMRSLEMRVGETVSLPFKDVAQINVLNGCVASASKITDGTVAITSQAPGTTVVFIWSAAGRDTLRVRVTDATTPATPDPAPLVRPVILSSPDMLRTDQRDGDDTGQGGYLTPVKEDAEKPAEEAPAAEVAWKQAYGIVRAADGNRIRLAVDNTHLHTFRVPFREVEAGFQVDEEISKLAASFKPGDRVEITYEEGQGQDFIRNVRRLEGAEAVAKPEPAVAGEAAAASGKEETATPPETTSVTTPAETTAEEGKLRLRQSVDKTRTVHGDVLTYSLKYSNPSMEVVEGVALIAQLPPELEYVPESATEDGEYVPEEREVRWDLGTLAVGAEGERQFRARIIDGENGAQIHTIARLETQQPESVGTEEPAPTEIVPLPLLAAFALPDKIVAHKNILLPLLDIETETEQRVVDRLQGLDILNGYPDHTFRPQASLSRAEATKMLVVASNLTTGEGGETLRDTTAVTYALSRPATVNVALTDAEGRVVRRLVTDTLQEDGSHAVLWEGRDENGAAVPPGQYWYEVSAVGEDGTSTNLRSVINVVSTTPIRSEDPSQFSDVQPGNWYRDYVVVAEQKGLVRGYPGQKFLPQKPITRLEETVIVVRAGGPELEQKAEQISAEAQTNPIRLGFDDDPDIPGWAVGYVAVATTQGPRAQGKLLIEYSGNTFLPRQELTRSEAAMIAERFLDRDVAREMTVSGAVSLGTKLSINGRPVTSADNGRFREQITLQPELNMISVVAR